jgi:hypothetical protein
MSLSIDTRRISSVYALGQWFPVKLNTFFIDAYELKDIEESCPFGNESNNPRSLTDDPREPHATYYEMGGLYKKDEPEFNSITFSNSPRTKLTTIAGSQGVGFIDSSTGETVYFSIMEIRAFRCAPIREVIKKCPELTPQKEAAKKILDKIYSKKQENK